MRSGGQGLANEQSAQVGVDKHGAVSVPPVEGEESAFSRFQFGCLLFEVLINVELGSLGRLAKF